MATVTQAQSKAAAWRRLLRLHFAPVTLSAGLLGVIGGAPSPKPLPVATALLICAFAYGIGQVINDYFDRHADAINAPDRPLVSGAIDPAGAVATVGVAATLLIAGAAAFAPRVALWCVVAVIGELLYVVTKRFPLLGNAVNGADLAVMALVGGAATVTHGSLLSLPRHALTHWLLLAVVLTGYSLTSYFKDIPGDRTAGYRTIPVVLGARAARWAVLPFPACGIAVAALRLGPAGPAFWMLLVASAGLFAVAAAAVMSAPERRAYQALVWYTRATLLFALACAAAYRPLVAAGATPLILLFFETAIRETANTGQA
jgi:geranylgeranylglycerol-phosphate geranylgeranyltransferase